MPDKELIKRHVAQLQAAGASADEIEQYVRGATSAPTTSPRGSSLLPVAQGATLGFADEILGGINGLESFRKGQGFRKGYDEGVAKVRNVGKQFHEEHPAVSTTLEIAGGLAPAVLSGGLEAPSILRSIGTGAGYGAVSGVGNSEGVSGRLKGGAVGAVAGGVLGAAIPAVSSTVGKGVNVVRSVVNRKGIPATEGANRALLDALERDNVPLSSLRGANATRAPKLLLDMAGENMHGVARAAQGIPSKAKDVIPKILNKRQEGLGTRLGKDLEDALGIQGEDVHLKADELLDAKRANAKPLYEEAYKHGPVDDPRINQILQLPDFKKAYQHARTIAELEGVKLPEELTLNPVALEAMDKNPAFKKAALEQLGVGDHAPTVQILDYVKRGVDDIIRSGQHAPLEGGGLGPTRARALLERQHELLDLIDKHVPAYKAARQQYAGDLAIEKALEAGKNFLKEDPRVTRKLLSTMTQGERRTFNVGAIHNIKREIESAADGTDLTKRIFGTQSKRENIEALFDDPRAANQFREWVRNEAKLVKNKNAILGNSSTAGKLAEISDLTGAGNIGDIAGSMVTGRPDRAIRDAFRMAAQRRFQGVSRNVADELADRLTAQPGTQRYRDLLTELEQAAAKRTKSVVARNAGTRVVAGTLPGVVSR